VAVGLVVAAGPNLARQATVRVESTRVVQPVSS
jgi:hypothetical protein